MSDRVPDDIAGEQIDYYRARAPEYDDWWLRRGRYDRGEGANRRWFDEIAAARRALESFAPSGRVLELACGTGLWTEVLHLFAESMTAVDASREMIGLCRDRLGGARVRSVRFVRADLFSWEPDEEFDFLFLGFWLSHVPDDRFGAFWRRLAGRAAPGARVFFVDSLPTPLSTAVDHDLGDPENPIRGRRLDDGREYRIVKIFHDPATLEGRLSDLGWNVKVRTTGEFFLYGAGEWSGAG
ncbi:MAG: class I SAM-dependent methyltransferase [Candidatus Eisenbacteria bacterium]